MVHAIVRANFLPFKAFLRFQTMLGVRLCVYVCFCVRVYDDNDDDDENGGTLSEATAHKNQRPNKTKIRNWLRKLSFCGFHRMKR